MLRVPSDSEYGVDIAVKADSRSDSRKKREQRRSRTTTPPPPLEDDGSDDDEIHIPVAVGKPLRDVKDGMGCDDFLERLKRLRRTLTFVPKKKKVKSFHIGAAPKGVVMYGDASICVSRFNLPFDVQSHPVRAFATVIRTRWTTFDSTAGRLKRNSTSILNPTNHVYHVPYDHAARSAGAGAGAGARPPSVPLVGSVMTRRDLASSPCPFTAGCKNRHVGHALLHDNRQRRRRCAPLLPSLWRTVYPVCCICTASSHCDTCIIVCVVHLVVTESGIAATLARIAAGQEQMNNAIGRLERRTSSNVLGCLSSPRDPGLLQKVVQFYCKGRKCVLSGAVDPGDGGLAAAERVIAAHIIPMSQLGVIRSVNTMASRNKLTANNPKDLLLLQKKWEVLFDHHCWCLIPVNPLSSTPPNFLVKVFAPTDIDDADLSLLATTHQVAGAPAGSVTVTSDSLRTWIRDLHEYAGKTISFQPSAVPSYRALSWHAQRTVDNATEFGWIESGYVYEAYAELSPMLSPRTDADEHGPLAKRGRPADDEDKKAKRDKRFGGSDSSGQGSIAAGL